MAEYDQTFSSYQEPYFYKTILEVSKAIAVYRDLTDLIRDLAVRLPVIVPMNFIAVALHRPERQVIQDFVIEGKVSADIQGGIEWALDEHPAGTVLTTQEPYLCSNISEETCYPKAFSAMQEDGILSLCAVPLTTALRPLGALLFASIHKATYDKTHVELLQLIGNQIAIVVDNILHVQELRKERDRSRLLLEVNNAVVSNLELGELFSSICTSVRRVIPHEITSLFRYVPETHSFKRHVLDFPSGKGLLPLGGTIRFDDTPAGQAFHSRKAVQLTDVELKEYQSPTSQQLLAEGMKSVFYAPLLVGDQVLGTLNMASSQEGLFDEKALELLMQVAGQIAIAFDNALAYEKIRELKEQLEQENVYLKNEIRTEQNFEDIIGESAELKNVLQQLEVVAPTDSTVLIQGETGTGKELIARALHHLSSRKERAFVKLNCAAIPTGLLESELFGHEKGAFTGAIASKAGRFELANRGTIFLDEVGEIPLELQSKLLRVLQEQEFERLGSTRTIRADVRLVAATNRDLLSMVETGEFRGDLYYRLNVFPITVPALRTRSVDIPILVRYFTQRYARRMNKTIETIPTKAMETLSRYHWPGNIRELENLIERAVILSQGSALMLPLTDLKAAPRLEGSSPQTKSTLKGVERDHILQVIRETKWVIGGSSGAAARLDMKRTTLISKMKKLNISRPS